MSIDRDDIDRVREAAATTGDRTPEDDRAEEEHRRQAERAHREVERAEEELRRTEE